MSDKFKKMFLLPTHYFNIFETLREKSFNKFMHKNIKRLFFSGLLFSLHFVASGQYVWPGDVNNNGIVNSVDVLYVGVAFGSNGASRPGGDETWEAQMLGDLWGQSFPDMINFAYADCDGNGTIEEDDIKDVIEENFLLTHGEVMPDNFANGTAGNAPEIQLIPQNDNIGTGQTAWFDIYLGTEDFPVDNFYGIALQMSYNPDFVLGSEWEFEEESNGWYDPDDEYTEEFLETDEANGKIEMALTRTNQESISGFGKIGSIKIVIEDIVFGLQDTLDLQIDNILVIDKDFNKIAMVPDSTSVIISSPNATNYPEKEPVVSVYPNPNKGKFNIKSNAQINQIKITDIMGRPVSIEELTIEGYTASLTLEKSNPQNQLLLVTIITRKGIITKKITSL